MKRASLLISFPQNRASFVLGRLVCCVGILMCALLLPCRTQAQKQLAASEAKEHIGEVAKVCGDVVSARYAASTKGQPTFLNLDKAYPSQVFTVLIWGSNRHKFGQPEDKYRDKRICVTGKITEYRGVPEIVVEDLNQIAVEADR